MYDLLIIYGINIMSSPSDPNRSLENRSVDNQAASNQAASNQAASNQAASNQAASNQAASNQAASNQGSSNQLVMRSNKKKQKQSVKHVKNRSQTNQTLRVNRNQPINNNDDPLTRIEKRVTKLEKNVEELQKYTKLEATFQELQNTVFIYKLYKQNHPFHRVDIIHISRCEHPTKNPITDFDGLLFVQQDARLLQWNHGAQRNMKNRWNAMYHNQRASSNVLNRFLQSTPSHKNATLTNHSDPSPPHYILIESKHSLSKGKVDKKIKQIDLIHKMLRDAPSVSNGGDEYNKMIQKWIVETHLPIDQLDHTIELIFSSDDIPDTLLEYMIAIHDGMTEEIYDRIVHKLMFEDKYMTDTISTISYQLKKRNKSPVSREPKTLSMKEIRDILLEYATAMKRKHDDYAMDYLTPFSELEELFQQMKHRVGALRFGHVSFSSLFKEPELTPEVEHPI
jgi:hypothetical protein